MKIALVHDQIAEFGGAERVLISLKKAFPSATVYTSFVDKTRLGKHWHHFERWNIVQSWVSKVPFFSKLYSPLRFLLPLIWRSFDFLSYDIVICSSSWGMCKGVSLPNSKFKENNSKTDSINPNREPRIITHEPKYICYLHTPPRYLYGYDESDLKKYWFVRLYALIVNHFLRQYDYDSSQTIDQFIFNSEEIRKRSLKFYRKDGIVMHPPIQTPATPTHQALGTKHYYLTVSRLAPTKHIDLIIQAANQAGFNLKIVGTGKEYEKLRSLAGPTVELLGSVLDEELSNLYVGAKAFVYASVNEDFGMVPVEAMAHGIPVIAFNSGGVKETVRDGKNGFLYNLLMSDAIIEKVTQLENLTTSEYQAMSEEALEFARTCSEDHFVNSFRAHLAQTPVHEA